MEATGRCGCGSVTFSVRIDPERAGICHCQDCQRQSGSAFRTVVRAEDGSFELLSGELKTFERTADSGNVRSHAFCPDCGTQIYGGSPGPDSKRMSVRVGTLDQRDRIKPATEIFVRSRLPWLDGFAGLTEFDAMP